MAWLKVMLNGALGTAVGLIHGTDAGCGIAEPQSLHWGAHGPKGHSVRLIYSAQNHPHGEGCPTSKS